jgi:hypothetical protein
MPEYGAGARVRGARERGGPQPRAERTLERDETRSRGGGGEPSSGAEPLEGGVAPRTGQNPPEGERALERGGAYSRRLLCGLSWWAVGVPAWTVSCMVSHLHG